MAGIQYLAWEFPYAAATAKKIKIKVKKKIVLYGLEIVYKEIYDKFRAMVTLKGLQLGEGTLLWGFLIGSFLIRMIRT